MVAVAVIVLVILAQMRQHESPAGKPSAFSMGRFPRPGNTASRFAAEISQIIIARASIVKCFYRLFFCFFISRLSHNLPTTGRTP